jgi:hypothetical protein
LLSGQPSFPKDGILLSNLNGCGSNATKRPGPVPARPHPCLPEEGRCCCLKSPASF